MNAEQKKAYDKEVYNWRKAHKICVYCGHKEAQNGHFSCLQCRMKANECVKRYYHEKFSDEQRYRKNSTNKGDTTFYALSEYVHTAVSATRLPTRLCVKSALRKRNAKTRRGR